LGKKKGAERRSRVFIPYEKTDDGPSIIAVIIMLVAFWPVGLLLAYKKLAALWKKKKLADYRNYAAIIADRCEVDVREISAKLGKTTSLVFSDLQIMIDKGYMGSNAYLDRSRGMLILDALETDFADEYEYDAAKEEPGAKTEAFHPISFEEAFSPSSGTGKGVKTEEKVKSPETFRESVRASVRKPENIVQKNPWQDDEYEQCLRQIRQLNDEIDDEAVSRRIDRIGELSASIFTVIRQRPEYEDEVRKFMSYYLPTTFKLLKSYSLMEKQTYQGETITASRKKIEDILDTLIGAFEKQQDQLFHTDAMDVEADIQVLETMLAKDGLAGGSLDLRAMAAAQGIKLGAGDN